MLEIRPTCENCGKSLPNGSDEALICTFECTFCRDCVENVLFNVCPNCGGGFEKRPTRPNGLLERNPVQTIETRQPVEAEKFAPVLEKYRNIAPRER